ncbi:MAG: hypothetical protein OEY28_13710, partial [Nitrospira sp.]|nr:hypothetical protein [Nitrospira sp.]
YDSQKRLSAEEITDEGSAPGAVWRRRQLAGSSLVRDLVDPSRLLAVTDVVRVKRKAEQNEDKESAE